MNIDTVGLVSKYPSVVVHTIVDLPSISFLVDFGAEHSRYLVLDYLENCGRVYDHKVDVYASSGIATCGTVRGRSCKSYLGVKSAGRYSYNSHSVIHFDFAVYIGVAVLGVTSDVALEVAIDKRIYEQYSSLIGNFLVVKCRFCGLDKVGDVVAAGQGGGCGASCVGGVLCKSVQFVIVKAFYPLPLMVSHKFSISFQPC